MRSIALACGLLLGMATAAMAQATSGVLHDGDAALTFHSVHTNAPRRRVRLLYSEWRRPFRLMEF
jgi:hypothetical protein